MNFQFHTPFLSNSNQYHPDNLITLTSNLPDPTISVRTVDEVLKAIEQGKVM
ncbi:hypothetical protein QUB80_08425 [Chlorogloeopsis sp. ULAP01]|uniref:hypothetical protein n=1 Tax=Chlorogloeopsis sp. ULAP01 TaxID=3056483 RepID=UPI0025AABE80|nr:hypothetical protein [Chlorogloeopsis sp. ULAP01]MDM9380730.1 hypothetical protein [Chlorogloeopsis sp. ULAP01]